MGRSGQTLVGALTSMPWYLLHQNLGPHYEAPSMRLKLDLDNAKFDIRSHMGGFGTISISFLTIQY